MPPFVTNPLVSLRKTPIKTTQIKCRKYKGFLPNITPSILLLSQTSSAQGSYAAVFIQGENFSPYSTTVAFGPISNIPIVYYSSNTISFVVPMKLLANNYNVQVVTNATNTYNIVLLSSNKLGYTITKPLF